MILQGTRVNTLEYHVKTLSTHTYTATIVDLSPTIALLSISFNFLFFRLLSKFYTHHPQLLTYLPQLSGSSGMGTIVKNIHLELNSSSAFHKFQFYVKLEFLKSGIVLNIFSNNSKTLKISKNCDIWLFLPKSMSIRIFFLKLLLKEWSLLMHSKWLFLLKAATLMERIQKLSEI